MTSQEFLLFKIIFVVFFPLPFILLVPSSTSTYPLSPEIITLWLVGGRTKQKRYRTHGYRQQCDWAILKKDVPQRHFPNREEKGDNFRQKDKHFKKKIMWNNIGNRETPRLNLNNDKFAPIKICMWKVYYAYYHSLYLCTSP